MKTLILCVLIAIFIVFIASMVVLVSIAPPPPCEFGPCIIK